MSYIRTENGIYDLSNKYSQTPEAVQIALMTGNYKQADTIEELCNEFVFVDFGIFNDKEYHFKTLEESKKCNALYDRCYGAIWTSRGLIYVAKMNKKGEFELI